MSTFLEIERVGWAKPGIVQRALGLRSNATARQGFLSLVDQGVVSATNFLTGVIIARACSKEELGLYMLGFSVILFVTDIQTSLIATPYMVYAPRLRGKAHALYTGSTLVHQLTLCFLVALALVGGEIVIRKQASLPGLGPVLWALLGVATFMMLREYARRVCFACIRLIGALALDSIIAAAQICGLLLLARFGILSAFWAFWVIGFACAIAVVGWLWVERSLYLPRINESLADFKRNWTFGKWVFASGLVWIVSMDLYPWLLASFHGTASAGVWAACVGAVALGNPALLGVQNFLGPKIAHVHAHEGPVALGRFVLRASLTLGMLLSSLCLVMALWGGPVVVLLYGHQYAGYGLIVTIMAVNLTVSALAFSFSRALFAIERADVDFAVSLLALLAMLSVGVWLVRSFSVLGAAAGLLAANVVSSGVRAGAFIRLRAGISGHRTE